MTVSDVGSGGAGGFSRPKDPSLQPSYHRIPPCARAIRFHLVLASFVSVLVLSRLTWMPSWRWLGVMGWWSSPIPVKLSARSTKGARRGVWLCWRVRFYPNKQVTTGEGGMLVTDRDDWDALFRSLRNQGRDVFNAWLNHTRLGYNYRLDEMSAALGLAQLIARPWLRAS